MSMGHTEISNDMEKQLDSLQSLEERHRIRIGHLEQTLEQASQQCAALENMVHQRDAALAAQEPAQPWKDRCEQVETLNGKLQQTEHGLRQRVAELEQNVAVYAQRCA